MSGEVTSRERVVAALNHEELDRVPIDFGSNYNTCVNVIAYNRLKKHLGIKSPTYMRYTIPMLAAADLDDGLEVIKRMGGDVLPVPRYWTDGVPTGEWKQWTLKDGSPCMIPAKFSFVEKENGDLEVMRGGVTLFRMPKNGFYFDRTQTLLASVDNITQLEEMTPWLRTRGFFRISDGELEILEGWARRTHEETDYAVIGDPYTFSLYQLGHELFGYERFFIFLVTDPELVHYWMNFLTEIYEEFITRYLKAVGKYINVFLIGDDYGHQQGPQISVEMFREFFKRHLTRICDVIHEASPNVKVLLHSCGSITPLIPEFIDCGIDALNPVQCTAKNMDPVRLKREFGEHIVFWGGGVSAQTTLFSGTIEDVRKEVRERLEIFKPGGGYVFTTDHDIQEHVSPEKIVAIYETAQQYGKY